MLRRGWLEKVGYVISLTSWLVEVVIATELISNEDCNIMKEGGGCYSTPAPSPGQTDEL